RYNKVPLGGQLVETTGLQVVKNAGWVVPYVSCMMVFVGMFAHFGVTFANFSNRYARGAIPGARVPSRSKVDESAADAGKSSGLLERLMTYVALYLFPDVPGIELIRLLAIKGDRLLVPALSLAFCLSVGLYFAKPTSYSRSEVDWEAIGALPVQHEGRIKAFDAVARNLLQVISKPLFGSVPYVKDENGKKRTPSEWLLGVMAGRDWVKKAEVFRIYPPEVRDIFDLKPRKGYRYSYAELEPNLEKFRAEIAPLREKESDEFDHREQKLAQMHGQINLWDLVALSYQLPPLPSIPADDASEDERNVFFQSLLDVANLMRQLEKGNPPAMLPPPGEATQENMRGAQWQAYGPAFFARLMEQLGMPIAEQSTAFFALDDLFKAVRNDDVPAINKAVADYREKIAQVPIAESSSSRAAAESWLIKFNPTAQGVLIYLIAIVLGFSGFLFRSDVLRRATFWVLVGVFVIHTVAIVSRIYVSGRAPVINLYSSAVFIGWACVLLGIVLEAVYPIGIANLVSGLIGISTLSVARFLDTQDTLHVLQAVLDTQFWLSTHVITVTAGYAVTFLAGFIGICALVHRMATGYDSYPPGKRPVESEEFQQIMGRMIYGIVCFAIFFSFIGTVLGGLWADDSWGRFWGWDPKENGALMIVLWNALLLHARWDKQVGQRGFAALAVLGNVVTAWSWFGTNQLGIGLHAYGFTSGALYSLIGFISANLVFVLVSLMVTHAFSAGVKNVARGT
ncbi:MAG: cytochrome c biogenesis protein CcsA, partial [Planctomycetales bacterium]|nr:cytochrome c biogenesis protein CcsA [Planctomycetales bacterium]